MSLMIRSGPGTDGSGLKGTLSGSRVERAAATRRVRVLVCTPSQVSALVVRGLLERLTNARVDWCSPGDSSESGGSNSGREIGDFRTPETCGRCTTASLLDDLRKTSRDLLILDTAPYGRELASVVRRVEESSPETQIVLLIPVEGSRVARSLHSAVAGTLQRPLDMSDAATQLSGLLAQRPGPTSMGPARTRERNQETTF